MLKFTSKTILRGSLPVVVAAMLVMPVSPIFADSPTGSNPGMNGVSPDQDLGTVEGTLVINDNTITIEVDADDVDLADADEETVNVLYDSSSLEFKGLMMSETNSTAATSTPTPPSPPSNSLTGNTSGSNRADAQNNNASNDNMQNNNFPNNMQNSGGQNNGMVSGSSPSSDTPATNNMPGPNGANQNMSTVEGPLVIDDNVITIEVDADEVELVEVEDDTVNVLYDKDSLEFRGVRPNGDNMSGANWASVEGTLVLDDSTITIDISDEDIDLDEMEDETVNILYDESSLEFKGVMLAADDETTPTPQMAGQDTATVEGNMDIDGDTITIDIDDDDVDLDEIESETVNVLYDESSGEFKGVMLSGSDEEKPTQTANTTSPAQSQNNTPANSNTAADANANQPGNNDNNQGFLGRVSSWFKNMWPWGK